MMKTKKNVSSEIRKNIINRTNASLKVMHTNQAKSPKIFKCFDSLVRKTELENRKLQLSICFYDKSSIRKYCLKNRCHAAFHTLQP